MDRHKNRCFKHESKLSALPGHCHEPDVSASAAFEWRLLAVKARFEGRPLESLRPAILLPRIRLLRQPSSSGSTPTTLLLLWTNVTQVIADRHFPPEIFPLDEDERGNLPLWKCNQLTMPILNSAIEENEKNNQRR